MARRSIRWTGLCLSGAFAIAAMVMLGIGGQASALPGSAMPKSELEDLQGATCNNWLLCQQWGESGCGTPFVCQTAECYGQSSCDYCYLDFPQASCGAGGGFFDTCEDTIMNCGKRKHGHCDFVDGQCRCVKEYNTQTDCTGANCVAGC